MNSFRADLHCHTSCSDGSMTPTQIIHLAKEIGLSGLAITDHDTIASYPEALPIAKELNLGLISGIEFSAAYQDNSVHILGYSFDLNNALMISLCERHKQRRELRNFRILELLASHNMPISIEELAKEGVNAKSIGRPHIALVMVKKGYILTPDEAFYKYLGEGRSCYVSEGSFSIEETIDAIHQAGGFAVVAHPHLIKNHRTLSSLLEMPFDGIEALYARYPAHANERWLKIAKRKNWLVTGGSDFHGSFKPNIQLGCSWIGEPTFRFLQERFRLNNRPLA